MISKNTEPQTVESGYRYALRLLTGRDYTCAALLTKLAARDVNSQDAETVVNRLQQEGFLDDRRHAERFAAAALASGRFFGSRLRLEMRRRGFETALVNDILSAISVEHDQETDIRAIMESRHPGFSFSAADDREKRKVIGFLQRRGFGFSAIMTALRTKE